MVLRKAYFTGFDGRFSALADKLKANQRISPEAFEIVTILMVQMTHFEHVVLDSTPSQLIDILNEYGHFIDDSVRQFDCRKMDVEVDLVTVREATPFFNTKPK